VEVPGTGRKRMWIKHLGDTHLDKINRAMINAFSRERVVLYGAGVRCQLFLKECGALTTPAALTAGLSSD
jgi:hypothetical protein